MVAVFPVTFAPVLKRLCAALRLGIAVFVLLLGALASPAHAQVLQPVPPLAAHVIDPTGTLTGDQKEALEAKLADFEHAKGSQVVILMVPTTQPEDIASYANRVGNAWKIGRDEVGDGLIIVVAKNDRKVRIEVAKALEGAVPDLAAKRIIDSAITPAFKAGDYAGGLGAAADQIIGLINGEALPEPERKSIAKGLLGGFDWVDLAIFLFFAVPIAGSLISNLMGRKIAGLLVGGGVGALALVATSSMLIAGVAAFVALLVVLFSNFSRIASSGGWGSGGGGGWSSGSGSSSSSSGGSFSSGGGGDFGGGGASGDW